MLSGGPRGAGAAWPVAGHRKEHCVVKSAREAAHEKVVDVDQRPDLAADEEWRAEDLQHAPGRRLSERGAGPLSQGAEPDAPP